MKMQKVMVVKGDFLYGGWPWQPEEIRYKVGETFEIPVGKVELGGETIDPLAKLGSFVKVIE